MSQICFRQFSVKLNDKIAGFFFLRTPHKKILKTLRYKISIQQLTILLPYYKINNIKICTILQINSCNFFISKNKKKETAEEVWK